jgi:hypothetical protein
MRVFQLIKITAVAVAAVLAVGGLTLTTPSQAQAPANTMTTSSGLQFADLKAGTGASPRPGQICIMHYTGWLYQNGKKGAKFDSSVDRGQPFEFPRRQARPDHPAGAWIRRAGRRRRDSAERHLDVRGRAARRALGSIGPLTGSCDLGYPVKCAAK